jgi:hypothetical protein
MTNAARLLDILRINRFDFLIHGHKHNPFFQTIAVNGDFPLAVLSAGSFSAELDRRWSGFVNNQFHLVTIDGRDPSSGYVFGSVNSWTYLAGHGWVPSREHNGIQHVHPFGHYLQPAQLKKKLRTDIQSHLLKANYVLWNSIVTKYPKFAYLPPSLLNTVLDELSLELGFTCHHGSQGLILLKEA